jgi:prepilin-type N-terminal cleavage/methylation domain-containing protein
MKNKFNLQKISKVRGFTLVELLTVVAIISILTGISIVGLQEIRKKAQDTSRLANMKEIQIALETYKSVNGGKYPDAGTQGSDAYISNLTPAFISKLSKDPSGTHNGVSGYVYKVSTDKKSYCFKIINTVVKAAAQKDLYSSNTGENTWVACSGPGSSGL